MTRKVYRSLQGKLVDMELLSQKHELAPAIGNMRVNARGDELGPGGKIIRKREDIMAEYYDNNPNAVKDETYVKTKSKEAALESSTSTAPAPRTSSRRTEKKEVKNEDQTNS